VGFRAAPLSEEVELKVTSASAPTAATTSAADATSSAGSLVGEGRRR
jgi:hypothetical protein